MFKWQGTDSQRYIPPNVAQYSWSMKYMEPLIESSVFDFTIKIHQCSQTTPFMVGITSKDHDAKGGSHFGRVHAWGWNAYSSSGLYYGHGNGHHGTQGFQTGESITFKINKDEKTIEFWKRKSDNDDDQLVHTLRNQSFPADEMKIAISVYQLPVEVELVEFIDHENNQFFGCHFEQESMMMEETRERLEYVCEKCGNFKIPMRNKTLNLWKPFLIHSNIKDLGKIDQYNGLEDLSLDVDELTILQFLLGYYVFPSSTTLRNKKKKDGGGKNKQLDEEVQQEGQDLEKYLDYFRFFHHLGLKKEMLRILRLLSTQPQNFRECYDLFISFTKEFETDDEIRTWFTTSPKMLDPPFTFSSSLSLALFNRMKFFLPELTLDSPLMFLPYVNIIAFHLKKYKKVEAVDTHPEISTIEEIKMKKMKQMASGRGKKKKNRKRKRRNMFDSGDDGDDEDDLPGVNKMLKKLYQMRTQKQGFGGVPANLKVVTSDEQEIPVHREVLIVRSNFFYKMLSFGGRETVEMEKEAKVRIIDLKFKEVMTLVRYFYTGQISSNPSSTDLETLIICLDHAHKYFEDDFLIRGLLDAVSETVNLVAGNRRRILECFKKTGHLLQNNEELKEMIMVSIFGKKGKKKVKNGMTRKHVLDALRKAEKQKFEDSILQENKLLKEKVKKLEKKVEGMEKEIKSFEDFKKMILKRVKKLEGN